MIRKTRGIVLHTTRYGESSLVVHCYTELWGRQTFMAKGVRKSRRQNRSNLFQPLFILDFEVYHKDSRELQLVKEVNRAIPLNSIPFDITKSTQAIFMAEVLYRVVKEQESNPILANFLISTIQYLDALEEAAPDFHILFMFQLSRHLGFYPQNNFGEERIFFNLDSGQFKAHFGNPELFLNQEDSKLWSHYMQSDLQALKERTFNGAQRKQILDNLLRFYKFHVSGMAEIRSLEVLHSYFVK
ncbi:MAG: DNA repair protein RecO [Bacteroidales bacterium]|nr:DNA repair protein RecO [Bacteroidales bacterium]